MTFDPTSARPLDDQPEPAQRFNPAEAQPAGDALLRAQIRRAMGTDPLKASQAEAIARARDLDPEFVLRNYDQVLRETGVEDMARALEVDPMVGDYFRYSPLFAAKAQKDAGALIDVHGTIREFKGPEPTFENIARGLAASLPQGLDIVRTGLQGQMRDFLQWAGLVQPDPVADADFQRKLAQAQGAGDFTRPEIQSRTGRAIYGGLESTLRTLPGVAASVVTRNPTPALATMGLQTQADAYGKYRTRGGAPLESFLGATGEGAVEVATELLPTKFLTEALGKRGVGEFLTGLIAREAPTEQVATLLQDAIDTAVANPNKTWEEYLAERPGAAYDTLVSTLTQTLVTGGAAKVLSSIAGTADEMGKAEVSARQLQAAFAAAAMVEMRQHAPQDFAQAIQSIAEQEGANDAIYMDAEVLAQSGIDIAQALPSAVDQMADALELNATVRLPIGEVLAAVAGTPQEQLFLQNARASETAWSLAEAEQIAETSKEFLANEQERVLQQAQDQSAWQSEVDTVQQTIKGQLDQAGRFTSDVNESYARLQSQFFSVMASRFGITPTEMYQRFSVKVAGQMGQGEVLNAWQQPEFATDSADENGNVQPMQSSEVDSVADALVAQLQELGFTVTGINGSTTSAGRSVYIPVSYTPRASQDPNWRRDGRIPAYVLNTEIRVSDHGTGAARTGNYLHVNTKGQAAKVVEEFQRQAAELDQRILREQQDIDSRPNRAARRAAAREQATVNSGAFDPNDPNILRQSARQTPGPDAPGVGLEEGNKLGFWPALRVKLTAKLKLPEKAPILTGTTNANAGKQIAAIDGILKKFPKATESTGEWTKMMAYALGSTEVPIPPYAFIRDLNGTGSVDKLRTLTQGQIDDASHGFENAAEFRRAYVAGELGVETTGKLFMWSFLSRGVSPYTQEALFIDAFDGADKWIAMAARGEFTEAVFPEYEAWAKSVAPKGSGQPGAGATHNLNAFGQDFLFKMSRTGADGKTHMQRLHDMMSDPNQTGKQIRREFATFGEGVGIDNKVVSFTLLVAGFNDVMVLDRVQIRQLWDDGRFNGVNLYDGVSEKKMVTGKDGVAKMKPVKMAGSSLNSLAEGARGILVYEAIERGLAAKIQQLYAEIGRPQDASIGRYHWETWVADSQQEASHGTLGAILADAKGDDQAIARVSAKQGEYGAYEYGALYNRDPDGTPWFGYETPTGRQFAFSVPAFRAFLEDIKTASAGVVPTKFKVTESGNAPWYTRPEVNQARLDERAIYWADRAGGSGEGQRAVEEALQQQAASGAGSGAAVQPQEGGVGGEYQQAGDRAGRAAYAGPAPLPGAPVIEGATGPDPRLVAVAEQYARDNGIDLKRQGEYVQVDPERAARIAQAYDEMQHAPSDPAVQEAYQNLIAQTLAQYRALEAAGFKFWFIDPTNDPYKSPWDAMRDMRASQTMGVFPTIAGFGSGATDVDVTDNPLMGDTGIQWPYGSPDGELKPVLANDLFRAVHDAFGHGLEGAGFRAQGEENAWQAHIRLFTGSAKGAITSETRGQNSWLNFGPYGETNRTAKVEDTVFADQKTGLMPEWTWTEGLAPDMPREALNQGQQQQARGTFNPQTLLISLGPQSDLSTFLHESGHFFLEVMADLAALPDAPAQVREDMDKVLGWFGVPDLATWRGYTLEQKRPHHERWAESFEQYLLEGKAPSAELQPLFRRFRAWLVNVYKSLTDFMRGRNLELNDEIRQVFDRMLATDEQIAQAEEQAGLLPDFDATNEAIERLQERSLRNLKWTLNARSKFLKQFTKEAKELRKGVLAEVMAEFEQRPDAIASRAIRKVRNKDGAERDAKIAAIADATGYATVEEMMAAVQALGPVNDAVEAEVDRRMLERHGDLATEEAREQAANEAVHNEARARALAAELKSQGEAMNPRETTGRTDARGRPITVNALLEAARAFGADLAARRQVGKLKNAIYLHRAAEARAGKAWQTATKKGDTKAAVQAKRDQLLNNQAVRSLIDAQAEVRASVEFFRKILKGNNEKLVKSGRDPDVVNAMRAILGAYGIAPRTGKTALEYMELVQKNDPAMYGVIAPSVNTALANAKPFNELSVEEVRGLTDELKSLWHLAKRSRQMEIDGDLMDIEDLADQLYARMEDIGIPDVLPGEAGALTDAELRKRNWLQQAPALLRRVEQWAESKDGAFGGPFLRFIFQPVKIAADRYRADRLVYRQKFQALVDAIAPTMDKKVIAAPELGYTFGRGHNGIGMAELLHAILHTGNDSNKRKLLLGRNWATENPDGTLDTSRWDAFLQRMHDEGVLTKAHYDFAQGVWDLMEETKPLAQKTHRDVFGRYFAEVTANPVTTPFGTYRGGYVPAQADPLLVQEADQRELLETENAGMSYAFPATNKGFTKGRVEYNRPLKLDLRTLPQHIDKVLLFSHMEPAVRGVDRLLRRKKIAQTLNKIEPAAINGMLKPWLNRSARQTVETPVSADAGLNRVLSQARARTGMALMMGNISNTLQQITGFSSALLKVKGSHMRRAVAQYIADPKQLKNTVWSLSPYMADRASNEVAVLSDTLEAIVLNPSVYESAERFTRRHAYFLQTAMDNQMSPIIWTAAYNQALEEGMEDRMARRFADGVIRQTQGSTLPEDVSRIETGTAFARAFTQFIGYFNMLANTNATALQQIAQEQGLRKGAGKAFGVLMVGMMIPIWVAELIANALRGGPEDEDDDGYLDDWLAAVFGFGTLRGLFSGVPFLGQVAQSAVNRFNDNPADDKFSLSPTVSVLESAASAPYSVYKVIADEGSAQKAVRDMSALITVTTGLPAMTLARPIGYAAGVAQGKIEPTGPVDAARGVITGTASPESKNP